MGLGSVAWLALHRMHFHAAVSTKQSPRKRKLVRIRQKQKTGELATWYSNSRLAAWGKMSTSESQTSLTCTASITGGATATQLPISWEQSPAFVSSAPRGRNLFWPCSPCSLFCLLKTTPRAQDPHRPRKAGSRKQKNRWPKLTTTRQFFHRIERVKWQADSGRNCVFSNSKRPFRFI